MFLLKIIFFVAGLFMLIVVVTGLSLFVRVRRHIQDPFNIKGTHPPKPPPGSGDIIEGEYKVLDDTQKK